MRIESITKTYLSSRRSVYKTEGFLRQTRKFLSVDKLLIKVAESIYSNYPNFTSQSSVMVETEGKEYTLFFRFGAAIPSIEKHDIVFYKFLSIDKSDRTNDRRIKTFLSDHNTFSFDVTEVSDEVKTEEFDKIYLLSYDDKVNFPLLNPTQKKIVETEDKNVLVQGVAGSGKTNICIEKIVFCACRGYRGRVLYTTYSRGLLVDTKTRVTVVRDNIAAFIDAYEHDDVIFDDENHKKAIENRLGILFSFEKEDYSIDVLKKIVAFLDNNVDYFLIEDIFYQRFKKRANIADEGTFLKEYLAKDAGKSSGLTDKIKRLSPEIIYKEIYGMIFGKYDYDGKVYPMTREEYAESRSGSFSKTECEAIYAVAMDYNKFLRDKNMEDNNSLSRVLLDGPSDVYSVGIIDETQDFTQLNLSLIKKLCRKMFCVGDAQQMINPSYFSFGYLKRLMYGELTGVMELKHNYRNSATIEKVAEYIGELNVKKFGVHSFVLKGTTVGTDVDSCAVYIEGDGFTERLKENRFENLTVIVSTAAKKEELRKKLKNIE